MYRSDMKQLLDLTAYTQINEQRSVILLALHHILIAEYLTGKV